MSIFIETPLSQDEIEYREAWIAGAYDREYAAVEQARQSAYQQHSDPIMAQYLRDEATKEEWLAAVQKVKDEHPYPEKVE
jgi:hypothetical protein